MADKFETQFQTLLKRIAEEFKKCSSLEDLETLKENLEKEIESAKESSGLTDEEKQKLENAVSKEDLESVKEELEKEIETSEATLPDGNVVLRESDYWADQYVAVHGSAPQQQGPQSGSYTYGLEVVCNSTGTPQHIQLYYASTQGNNTTYNRSSSDESSAFTVGDLAVIGHVYNGSGNYSTAANFAMSNPEDLQVGDYVVYTENGWDWSFSQKTFDVASQEDIESLKTEIEEKASTEDLESVKSDLESALDGKASTNDLATKINMTGARGSIAGYETVGTSATISQDSPDSNECGSNVTVSNGTSGTCWTKIVRVTSAISITLGSSWKWQGGNAPDIASGGILVLCWCGSGGLAQFNSPE